MPSEDGRMKGSLRRSRREWLRSLGLAGLVGAGLAGCLGDDEESDEDPAGASNGGDQDPNDDESDDTDDASDPAVFAVTEIDPTTIEIGVGETFDLAVAITNTGDSEGTQEVELRIDGETVATERLTLAGGEEAKFGFADVETEGFDAAEYSFGVYTEDGGLTGTLVIEGLDEPDEGVLHHWPMEEGEGEILTDVVGGEDGTIRGVDWVANDWYGGSALENTGDGIVELTSLGEFGEDRNHDFAIAYTIESDDESENAGVMSSVDEASESFSVYYSSSFFDLHKGAGMTIRMDESSEAAVMTEMNGFLAGGVHRVVINKITNDAGNWEIFIDGERVETRVPANADEEIPPMQGNVHLFEDAWTSGRGLAGTLDNLIIFDEPLDADAAAADYRAQPWS